MEISDYKKNINEIYLEIGETVYEKYVTDQELNLEELLEKCTRIQELSDKIAECKNEILKLNERKQCKNCYQEIEITANYCPNCGFEQERVNQEETQEEVQDETEDEEEIVEEEKDENKNKEKK